MVTWKVVKCAVVLVVVVVVVLFRDFDFSNAHNIDFLLGKVGDYCLWFCQDLA